MAQWILILDKSLRWRERSPMSMLALTLVLFSFTAVSADELLPFQDKKKLLAPQWDSKPFWRESAAVEKMTGEDRRILVSVRSEKVGESKEVRLQVRGAGIARKPAAALYRLVSDLENLPKWSPYLKEARHDSALKQVSLHTKVLFFHARSLIQLEPALCEGEKCLLWEVLAGTFRGLSGGIEFRPFGAKADQCEIALRGELTSSGHPLPLGLTPFLLEGMMQKMAQSLREYAERTL